MVSPEPSSHQNSSMLGPNSRLDHRQGGAVSQAEKCSCHGTELQRRGVGRWRMCGSRESVAGVGCLRLGLWTLPRSLPLGLDTSYAKWWCLPKCRIVAHGRVESGGHGWPGVVGMCCCGTQETRGRACHREKIGDRDPVCFGASDDGVHPQLYFIS